jgi:septal ring factor EnvC (AmiA/AmiB activator)
MTTNAVPLESLAQRIARQQSELEALQQDFEARQRRLAKLKAHRDELENNCAAWMPKWRPSSKGKRLA